MVALAAVCGHGAISISGAGSRKLSEGNFRWSLIAHCDAKATRRGSPARAISGVVWDSIPSSPPGLKATESMNNGELGKW